MHVVTSLTRSFARTLSHTLTGSAVRSLSLSFVALSAFAYCRQLSKALQLECVFVPVAVFVVLGRRPPPAAAASAAVVVIVGGCCCCCFLAGWLLFCCVVSLEYDAACLCACMCVCLCGNVATSSHWPSLTNRVGYLPAPMPVYIYVPHTHTHTRICNCYAFCVVIVAVVVVGL